MQIQSTIPVISTECKLVVIFLCLTYGNTLKQRYVTSRPMHCKQRRHIESILTEIDFKHKPKYTSKTGKTKQHTMLFSNKCSKWKRKQISILLYNLR